jgi:SAM-dependent methyltransferase
MSNSEDFESSKLGTKEQFVFSSTSPKSKRHCCHPVGTTPTMRSWPTLRRLEMRERSGLTSALYPVCVYLTFPTATFRFGSESVDKMVGWTLENVPPTANASILEIGCGNGSLLFGLIEAGYAPSSLHGIDYSAGAVRLSQEIAKTKEGGAEIAFSECDFLADDPKAPQGPVGDVATNTNTWDLLLDKGTHDAIALGEKDEQGNSPAVRYPDRVARLLKSGGYFLITCAYYMSCHRWSGIHSLNISL